MSSDNTVTVKVIVTEETRNAFKSACAKNGRSMSEVLMELMQTYIRQIEGKK